MQARALPHSHLVGWPADEIVQLNLVLRHEPIVDVVSGFSAPVLIQLKGTMGDTIVRDFCHASPVGSRLDGSSGAVRLPLPGITAEFARYSSDDPLCCPSAHVTVRYRIDRTGDGPVVLPIDIRTTRG